MCTYNTSLSICFCARCCVSFFLCSRFIFIVLLHLSKPAPRSFLCYVFLFFFFFNEVHDNGCVQCSGQRFSDLVFLIFLFISLGKGDWGLGEFGVFLFFFSLLHIIHYTKPTTNDYYYYYYCDYTISIHSMVFGFLLRLPSSLLKTNFLFLLFSLAFVFLQSIVYIFFASVCMQHHRRRRYCRRHYPHRAL